MSSSLAIGVDVGGTNIRAGLVGSDGAVLKLVTVPVTNRSAEAVVEAICGHVESLAKHASQPLAGCGCGIPGIVNSEEGIVYSSPNYPDWRDVPILKMLRSKIALPLSIDNDANMFAFAELLFGAGKGRRNMVALTLGSGIGGGIIIDGKLFRGDRGFAGEVGHITVEPDGVACACGNRGCWEQYAASRAFTHFVHRLPLREKEGILALASGDAAALTPEFVAELAGSQNATAKDLWRFFGRYLGIGIASLVNVLGITTIVIGGGIARSWNLFIDAAKAEVEGRTYARNAKHLKLLKASLGDNTSVVGAASIFFE